MPKRWLDPSFFTDEKLAKGTIEERHLFAAMIANQDDDGRLLAHPGYLRSIAFPYDEFTNDQVKQMRDHLAQINPNIIIYQNDGNEYIQLKRHARYQRPRYYHPSKFPAPPGWPFKEEIVTPEQPSGNQKVTIEQPGGNQPATLEYTEGRVGRGKGGEGKGKNSFLLEKRRKQVSPDPRIKKILGVISEKVGYQIPNYAKEGMAIKRALKMGFNPEQFIACWEQMKTFAFWQGKWLPFANVTENLGEFAAGRLEDTVKKRKLPSEEELRKSVEEAKR